MSIVTGVIGCGSFARGIHLPNIAKLPQFELKAVADLNNELAEKAAKDFGASYGTSEYERLLEDDDIELVVICTPHNSHASLALEALNAGKHVLVEKPMALRLEEIPPLIEAVRSSNLVFSVGLNRRYSPLIQKAKDLMVGRKGPSMLSYRIVDQLWQHPWALDPEVGGGRILSETVHVFDVCAYLLGSEPNRIFAEGGALTHPDMPDTQDNAIMVLKFDDGSIVSIVHGDLGNAAYPKERIEMFIGGKTIVIDNFEHLEAVGFGDPIHIRLPEVDKGFVQELEALSCAIEGNASGDLVTVIDGARSVLCAIKAIESIKTGLPQKIELQSII